MKRDYLYLCQNDKVKKKTTIIYKIRENGFCGWLPPHRSLDNNEARFSLVRRTYSADVKVRPDISYDINNIQHTRGSEKDCTTIGEESFR